MAGGGNESRRPFSPRWWWAIVGVVLVVCGHSPEVFGESPSGLQFGGSKEPVSISAESLTLMSQQRTFSYRGKVEVTQGDLRITCGVLDGKYSEKNELRDLTARDSVVITKGPTIRAVSERAVYDAVNEVFTLTENPKIEQEGSVLEADVVKVFVRDNRTVAEGQVRVKIVQSASGNKTKAKLPL